MNIEHTCTDCGVGLEPPLTRCTCCGDPYCGECRVKREEGFNDCRLGMLRMWLADPHAMPLAVLVHFAAEVIGMDIGLAREEEDDEKARRLESALRSLNDGDMCVRDVYSHASAGVLHEFEASLRERGGDGSHISDDGEGT